VTTANHAARAARPVIAAAVLLFAVALQAQPVSQPRRIGVLNEAWGVNHPTVEGLRGGLRELGFEEGRDIVFDVHFTRGRPEATPAAARSLVEAGVDLIFTSSEAATQAAKQATGRIPIVFTLVGDPVTAGLLKVIAKPGENLTGVSSLTTELAGKRLELLKTLAPGTRRVWAIHYGKDPSSIEAIRRAQSAATQLDVELLPRPVFDAQQLASVLKEIRPGDAMLSPDVATLDIPASLLEAAIEFRVPAVFSTSLWVGHGGLVSYGPDYHAAGVQAARLVAKILRGARPGDLPVEGADRIDLAVNVKTASLLGVTVPRKLLLRADAIRR
jgi:putative tryptophan/tyrosine transport system substrate-binding protein